MELDFSILGITVAGSVSTQIFYIKAKNNNGISPFVSVTLTGFTPVVGPTVIREVGETNTKFTVTIKNESGFTECPYGSAGTYTGALGEYSIQMGDAPGNFVQGKKLSPLLELM